MATKVFSLEVLRALQGDCSLLHYGTTTKPGLALIDGGPDDVYQPFLRPRLEELRTERGLAEDKPMVIDLMMLSHIDDDHAAGLLELTGELLEDKENEQPRIVRILDLWHNTFDDIVGNDAEELAGAVSKNFGPASLGGGLPDSVLDELKSSVAPAVSDTVKIIASVPQGRQLRDDAKKLEIQRNIELNGKLVVATDDGGQLDMGNKLDFTVVGPMLPEVKKLQTAVRAWLKKHPEAQDKVSASALASLADSSPTNLSSIVVLAETADKSILFTGDALGDKILKGLEMVDRMDADGKIRINVLKGQHHGSDRNYTPEFFERVIADHYVFSGNGEYGNPERATFKMLADARGDDEYTIHLTYPIDEIDVERKDDWDTQRADEQRRHTDDPSVKVRAKWSNAKNSLAAYLADNPDVSDRLEFVSDGVPHIIDLLG
jgi:glyoxylase-like metal-dependent hydrolase (beta-lactamase superfamily II)